MFEWYKSKIFPYLLNKNLGSPEVMAHRRNLLSYVSGNILEIGIGTGLNLNLYPKNVVQITAVDVCLHEMPKSCVSVKLIKASAEKMDFPDNSFDTVVSTFSFCSIEDLNAALREISRVLKPGGKLLFLEHGKANTRLGCMLQNAANPLFNVFACGCNTNRNIKKSIMQNGFRVNKFQLVRGGVHPKLIVGYLYKGIALNEKGKKSHCSI